MAELTVSIDKSFDNNYALNNYIYYQSITLSAERQVMLVSSAQPSITNPMMTECYIHFKAKNYVKLAKQIYRPNLKDNCLYINSDDRIYLDVRLTDKLSVSIIPKPPTASSILISILDNTKLREIDTITDLVNTKIKSTLIQSVVNVNTYIGFLAPFRLNINIISILNDTNQEINHGFVDESTKIIFVNMEKKSLKINLTSINFENIGVGGLEREFTDLIKSIFITRIIPTELYKKFGIKHAKGAILYGPPGTGKTLIARRIGALIGCKNIKIINGPELLNKYVGESEKNIRECFETARRNPDELHLLIFDEFDSIAGKRSGSEFNQHSDKLVGQLLTELDGVEEMNNIIVFALTNRLDIIDPAILRPGRFGIHLNINLPDTKGRYEILKIHSKDLIQNNLLEPDFDFMRIAESTDCYTGAEIESLVQKTIHDSVGSKIDFNDIVNSAKKIETISIRTEDFMMAVQGITPMFKNNHRKKSELNDRIKKSFTNSNIKLIGTIIEFIQKKTYPAVICIGGSPKSGKTSIACNIAIQTNIKNIEYVSASDMAKMNDNAKNNYLTDIFSNKDPSLIILDNIEMIVEFVSEHIFNRNILHVIKCLLNETKHHVLITTSYHEKLMNMTVLDSVCYYEPII